MGVTWLWHVIGAALLLVGWEIFAVKSVTVVDVSVLIHGALKKLLRRAARLRAPWCSLTSRVMPSRRLIGECCEQSLSIFSTSALAGKHSFAVRLSVLENQPYSAEQREQGPAGGRLIRRRRPGPVPYAPACT